MRCKQCGVREVVPGWCQNCNSNREEPLPGSWQSFQSYQWQRGLQASQQGWPEGYISVTQGDTQFTVGGTVTTTGTAEIPPRKSWVTRMFGW